MTRRTTHRVAAGAVVALTMLVTTPSAAEESVVESDAPPRTYFDIDFTLLNAGVSVAGHVGSRVYLGLGTSVLPAFHVGTFDRYPIEIIEGHGFARWAPTSSFQADAGLRVSWVEDLQICVWGSCAKDTGTLVGPYLDLHAGFHAFKVGPRAAYAVRTETGEWGAMFFPLMLRVQLTP